MPSLTETEAGNRSLTWADVLFETVPEDFLYLSFNRAFEDRKDEYPLSAYSIKLAYQVLITERQKAAQKQNAESSSDHQSEYLSPHWKSCEICFDTGFAETARVFNGRSYRGVIKSFCCKYWERQRAFVK
jgi:hypothetical protein